MPAPGKLPFAETLDGGENQRDIHVLRVMTLSHIHDVYCFLSCDFVFPGAFFHSRVFGALSCDRGLDFWR